MSKNPNRELDALEEKLLAADEDFEDFYAQILAEFGEKPEDAVEAPMQIPEKAVEEVPVPNAYADKHQKAAPMKKDHSIRNLIIFIIIELMGIAGVALWWILRLL